MLIGNLIQLYIANFAGLWWR